MSTDNKSKFFLVAQNNGSYQGTIILPNGTELKGSLFANAAKEAGQKDWYRGDLRATDNATFNADNRMKPEDRPAAIHEQSTLKPAELRLNEWKGGKTSHIGQLYNSQGAFTVFANETSYKGRPALAGNIAAAKVAATAKSQPEASRPANDSQAPQADSHLKLAKG